VAEDRDENDEGEHQPDDDRESDRKARADTQAAHREHGLEP
jgi:hypothetical protein